MAGESSPAPVYEYDFFVSYTSADRAWAEWIAWQLKSTGYRVRIQAWHFGAGTNFVLEMNDAVAKSSRTVIVLSPDFLKSQFTAPEWAAAFAMDPTARSRKLVPVRISDCEPPPGLLYAIVHINLVGLDEAAAREELLTKIKGPAEPTTAPIFPGAKPKPAALVSEKPEFPGPSNIVSLPGTIPRLPAVGFVARRDEEGHDIVAQLKGTLDPAQQGLVVLWGPGGVGKTTLAAEAARETAGVFGKRIVWAGAQKRADFNFETLLDEIATQLGRADLRQFVTDKKVEQVVALLGESPALVVLDNFETLPTDEQKRCVEFLDERAKCSVLITTRENVAGTRNVRIQAMSPAEAAEFLTRLIDNTGNVQGFNGLDRDHIRQSAAANPLVMEWIVAQIALAQEPSTVLDELAHGSGDAAQRVFDRSFYLRQLGDDGQAALLALSLFVPDASRPALAEAAAFGDDLARLNEAVRRLASLCLIGTSAGGQRLKIDGLTRELSGSRLKQDKHADDFRRQFVAYFVRYAEAHPNETPDDLDALEVEKDNLLAAMDLAIELRDCQSVMRIAGELADVDGALVVHGYWVEAIRRGEQAAEAAREAQNEWEIARFAEIVATIRHFRGEVDEARRLYNESLEIQKKLGNQSGIAGSLHNLGTLAQNQGDLDEARRLYTESLEIQKKLGNQSGIADSLHNLGILAQNQGDLDEARRLYTESLEIQKKLGNQSGIADSLHNLGILAQKQGDRDEARRLYTESLEIQKKLGNQRGIAGSLHNLGTLAQKQGDRDEARRLYTESLEIQKKLGNQSGIADSLHNLGILAQKQGDRDEARRLYTESLEIQKKLGNQSGIAGLLHRLGILAQKQGDRDEARRLYTESLEIQKKLGNQSGIAGSLHNLGTLAQNQGDLDEARRLYTESLEIQKKLGNQSGIADSLHNLGILAQKQGDLDEARRLYTESLEIQKKLGNQSGIADSLHNLGICLSP